MSTTHWAATSGGASGASAPTTSDDVTFDANSGMPAAIVLAAGTACNNFTVTGPAAKTQVFTLSANLAPAGAVAVSGNSAINRVLFQSSVPGVARTITVNTPFAFTLSNVDFMDITGAGTASPFAGTSIGDCLGNSGITFTASATQTATGTASFTWSTHGWTTRVPLPQDDVVISNAFIAGRTVTVDMPRIGRNIDLSGATGAPTWTAAAAVASFGDVKLGASWIMTSSSTVWTLSGRGSQTITTNGIGTGNAIGINTPGATYSLQDDLLVGSTATKRGINHGQGTLTTNDHAVTCGTFVQNSLSSTRVNNWGASTVTITGTGNVLFIGGSGSTTTWNAGTSTFSLTNTTGTAANISSTQTFNHITLAAGGAFAFTANTAISGNLTIGALATVTMTAGITPSFTSTGRLVSLGSAGNLVTFKSGTPGTAWNITKASGTISVDFVSITDSHASGGASFFAGTHSTDGGGNTGWVFTAPAFALADATVATDAFVVHFTAARSMTDAPVATDGGVSVLHGVRASAEAAVASEGLARLATYTRSSPDPALAADVMSRVAARSRSAADNALAAEAVIPLLSASRPVSDPASASEAVTLVSALRAQGTQAAAALDVGSRGLAVSRVMADLASGGEVAAASGGFSRALADTAIGIETAARHLSASRPLADAANAVVITARQASYLGAVSDVAGALDAYGARVTLHSLLVETPGVAESLIRALGASRTGTSTASAIAGGVAVAALVRTPQETLTVIDVGSRRLTSAASLTDSASALGLLIVLGGLGPPVGLYSAILVVYETAALIADYEVDAQVDAYLSGFEVQ